MMKLLFMLPLSLFAAIDLDKMMTEQDKKNTGVARLTPIEKLYLEGWMNDNLIPKPAPNVVKLNITENLNNGKQLRLSDGTLYEVAPEDVARSSQWLTTFPITIGPSGDPRYPFTLTNTNTGASIKVRKAS